MSFEFKEIRPKIYLLSFDNGYDLAMHFLRFQEYYESPNPKFRKHVFSLIEYMEWYSKSFGNGSFTYMSDWGGFNIPGWVLHDVFKKGVPDWNKYDAFMKKLFDQIRKKYGKDFYLIGIKKGEEDTFKHELAHALWTVEPKYKELVQENIKSMPKDVYKFIRKYLLDNMYDESVVDDEVQAYLSTGLNNELKHNLKENNLDYKETAKIFSKTLDNYLAGIV